MTDTTQLSQIRALLHKPSSTNFRELLSLATDPLLVEYLDEHLRAWPEHRRFAETLSEAAHPLSRHAILTYKRAPRSGDWAPMPHLRHLSLMHYGDSKVDTSLRELSMTPRLQYLALRGLRTKKLSSLKHCPELEELLLSDCEVETLDGLAHCSGLRSLWLYWCHSSRFLRLFSDDLSLKPLARCQALEELKLQKTPTTGLESLVKLPRLERLSLLEIEMQDFDWMASMPALRSLRLEGEYGADPSKTLPPLPKLESLEMVNASSSLLRALPYQPRLRELAINQMSEPLRVALLRCQNLRVLRLNRWAVRPQALESLETLSSHPALQTIVLEESVPPPELLDQLQRALPDCEIRVAAFEQDERDPP